MKRLIVGVVLMAVLLMTAAFAGLSPPTVEQDTQTASTASAPQVAEQAQTIEQHIEHADPLRAFTPVHIKLMGCELRGFTEVRPVARSGSHRSFPCDLANLASPQGHVLAVLDQGMARRV